jgi:hypothetical protein
MTDADVETDDDRNSKIEEQGRELMITGLMHNQQYQTYTSNDQQRKAGFLDAIGEPESQADNQAAKQAQQQQSSDDGWRVYNTGVGRSVLHLHALILDRIELIVSILNHPVKAWINNFDNWGLTAWRLA